MAVKIVRRALPHSSEEIEVRLTTGVHSLTLDDGTKIRILEENVTNMTKIQDYLNEETGNTVYFSRTPLRVGEFGEGSIIPERGLFVYEAEPRSSQAVLVYESPINKITGEWYGPQV